MYGFPASVCISVNTAVVHGIPGNYTLKSRDIVSIDCGAFIDAYHGNAARTFSVGDVTEEAKKLIEVTKDSFFKGIEKAQMGNRLSDISHEIQLYAELNGFSVVRDFVGYGIGKKVHENRNVPNFDKPKKGPKLEKGMTLAIEPMLNIGKHNVKTLSDGWTVVTADGSLAAHYENTIAILPDGPEILTLVK